MDTAGLEETVGIGEAFGAVGEGVMSGEGFFYHVSMGVNVCGDWVFFLRADLWIPLFGPRGCRRGNCCFWSLCVRDGMEVTNAMSVSWGMVFGGAFGGVDVFIEKESGLSPRLYPGSNHSLFTIQ